MRWKIYSILFVGFLILSCNQKRDKDEGSEKIMQIADDFTMEFSFESLTENDLSLCHKQKCPEITINYLQAKGDGGSFDKINREIKDFVIASFYMDENANIPATIKDAAIGFSKRFHQDITQYPTTVTVYSAEIDVEEIYNTPNLVSLELVQYLYTGGAHGNGSTTFLNVNPKDGSRFALKDLIEDEQEFLRFAEKQFRKEHNIAADQPINSTGFWFENEVFFLPETVGFTIDNLIFIYNDYEISSYAESPVELLIPREQARPYLKTPYQL